jgi:ABC-2 type transport system permease protein
MEFIVPGLVLMAAINSAFMNTAFSFYSAKFQKTVEEVVVSPTPYLVVVLGHITGGVLRALFTAFLVMGLALFFTHLSVYSFLLTFAFIFLTALLFSLAGLVNGVFATSFDTVSIVPTFVLTPLTYLGGVFYSVSLLPPIWQDISHWNPIFYMVNGFRYGMLGVADTNIPFSLAVLSLLVVALIGVNWYIFKSGKGLRT